MSDKEECSKVRAIFIRQIKNSLADVGQCEIEGISQFIINLPSQKVLALCICVLCTTLQKQFTNKEVTVILLDIVKDIVLDYLFPKKA